MILVRTVIIVILVVAVVCCSFVLCGDVVHLFKSIKRTLNDEQVKLVNSIHLNNSFKKRR